MMSLRLALALLAPFVPQDSAPIFDGSTLAGWEGDPRFWSVEEGAIVGRSTREVPCDETTYLLWRGGAPADFELTLSFRIEGGNSGVQVRSREAGRWRLTGYQADIEDGTSWTGCLYEQDGRGVVARRGERVTYGEDGARSAERFGEDADILAAFERREWNEYRIVARGPRIVFELNGVRTCELVDRDRARRSARGLIGLQLHAGPPMTVRFRDLRLRELEPADEVEALEPPPVATPHWIWLPGEPADGQLATFQRPFDLAGEVASATLAGSCDNAMDVFLNGELVASGGDWARPLEVDVAEALTRGPNHLDVAARNEGGPAGLQLALEVELESGVELRIVSDAGWRVASGAPDGWKLEPGGGDEWRAPALLGPLGAEPWGALPAPSRSSAASALPAEEIELPPGFRAELVYTVPRASEGSWVALTDAPDGRLYASAEAGGLFRITPPPLGDRGPRCVVERVDVDLGDAQGLLWAEGSLYAVVNSWRFPSGLYRLTDEDGDGRLDAHELLAPLDGAGEHGPHAVLLGPDGDRLYVLGGNHTALPAGLEPRNWGEDHLLPQRPDPGGHAVGITAPGGWVCSARPDGSDWKLHCWGLRNAYDAAFDAEGELFTFDSDMEWDVGLPWYRPTRVAHLVPNGDSGWRTGSGKWPAYYPDSLPGAVDIGLSSPTGVLFARELAFPAEWRGRLLVADWAYGVIHAVVLAPDGSSYTGSAERFASGQPLAVTDLAAGADGALYFTVGGRGTQSALYRVTHERGRTGELSGELSGGIEGRAARDWRRMLEGSLDADGRARPGSCPPHAVVWAALGEDDRFLRYAARVALEACDVASWRFEALAEERPCALVEAMVALARAGEAVDLEPVLARLMTLELAELDEETALAALRAYALGFIRLGPGDEALRADVAEHLFARFPDGRRLVDRELCRLLVYLEERRALPAALALLEAAPDQEEAIHHAFLLRNLREGWTDELRRAYFAALARLESGARGGASLGKYVRGIREEVESALEPEVVASLRAELEEREREEPPALDLRGRSSNRWTVAALEGALARSRSGRSFETGAAAWRATTCHTCHRIAGEGGSTGPDLTGAGGRFQPRDLVEAILEPSRVVSDQYRDMELVTTDGELLVGRIESEADGLIAFRTLPPEEALIELDASEIVSRRPHPLSRMPEGLVDPLTEDELLDLLAFVLAGGDPEHPAFGVSAGAGR